MTRSSRAPGRVRRREHVDVVGFVRRLDWVLLLAVAALVAYGLWAVAGITRFDVEGNESYYVVRQAIAAGLGFAGFLVALAIDPDRYRRAQKAIYGVTLLLMLLVFPLADTTRGSKRWIELGPFQFQPSEFGKLLFVLALAGFLADRARRLGDPRVVAAGDRARARADPARLQAARPRHRARLRRRARPPASSSPAIRWSASRRARLARRARRSRASSGSCPAAGVEVLKPYQVDRLTGFADRDRDLEGVNYNLNQSITAVGSGGLDGRGVDAATQTRLDYLPEHATDFVFASLAEQRGFFGAALLLGLYLLVVWRGLRVITVARDAFGAIAAGGIVIAFLFQVFINVGMTMGIAPVTGIPLPFVTVGGSSMVANLVAIGVLQAIYARGHVGRRRAR